MRIGVPVEPTGPNLVSATPDTVGKLRRLGYEVIVERGAGEGASFTNDMYEEAGATLVDGDEAWSADIVTTLDPPEDVGRLAEGAMLISRLAPARSPELLEKLRERKVTAIAMDAIPRISRAQSMDVLSSQANIAGYRAVIEAANVFGRLFTGQVTAAGKVPPATVYVIGAGVAGLAAIGTANSMGAIVEATDVRAEVAEQVESMGATFVPIPAPAQESADGYAKEMSAEQAEAAERLYRERAAGADIVITTANIPGRTAPTLLTKEAVEGMKPGSVIVDMAAGSGGNCELTKPGEIITVHGVTIIGLTELARRLPAQSSQLFGQNIVNFLGLITPNKDGEATLDLDDVICRQVTCTQDGETLWPPPPVQVSAAPAQQTPAPAAPAAPEEPAAPAKAKLLWAAIAACLGAALVLITPLAFIGHYMVLALAIIVGFYVITNVTHALHTPLMSVTNAISGIIIVGALLQVGNSNWLVTILSFIAITIASINVFGGFTVTHRMLAMFRKA